MPRKITKNQIGRIYTYMKKANVAKLGLSKQEFVESFWNLPPIMRQAMTYAYNVKTDRLTSVIRFQGADLKDLFIGVKTVPTIDKNTNRAVFKKNMFFSSNFYIAPDSANRIRVKGVTKLGDGFYEIKDYSAISPITRDVRKATKIEKLQRISNGGIERLNNQFTKELCDFIRGLIQTKNRIDAASYETYDGVVHWYASFTSGGENPTAFTGMVITGQLLGDLVSVKSYSIIQRADRIHKAVNKGLKKRGRPQIPPPNPLEDAIADFVDAISALVKFDYPRGTKLDRWSAEAVVALRGKRYNDRTNVSPLDYMMETITVGKMYIEQFNAIFYAAKNLLNQFDRSCHGSKDLSRNWEAKVASLYGIDFT